MKSHNFYLNELVWAKFEDYDWWPGVISKKKLNQAYEVFFCGEDNKAIINEDNLCKWETHFNQFTSNVSNKNLIYAIGVALKLQEGILDFKDHANFILKKDRGDIIKETIEYLSFISGLNKGNKKEKKKPTQSLINTFINKKRDREDIQIEPENNKEDQIKKQTTPTPTPTPAHNLIIEEDKSIDKAKDVMKDAYNKIIQLKDSYIKTSKHRNKQKVEEFNNQLLNDYNSFTLTFGKIEAYIDPIKDMIGIDITKMNPSLLYEGISQIADILNVRVNERKNDEHIPIYSLCKKLIEIVPSLGMVTLTYNSFIINVIKGNFFNDSIARNKIQIKEDNNAADKRKMIISIIKKSLYALLINNKNTSVKHIEIVDNLTVLLENFAFLTCGNMNEEYKKIIKGILSIIKIEYDLSSSQVTEYDLSPY